MDLLQQVTDKTASLHWGRTWKQAAAEIVLKESGNQNFRTYIDRQQTSVEKWVELIPIYEVCDSGTGY